MVMCEKTQWQVSSLVSWIQRTFQKWHICIISLVSFQMFCKCFGVCLVSLEVLYSNSQAPNVLPACNAKRLVRNQGLTGAYLHPLSHQLVDFYQKPSDSSLLVASCPNAVYFIYFCGYEYFIYWKRNNIQGVLQYLSFFSVSLSGSFLHKSDK